MNGSVDTAIVGAGIFRARDVLPPCARTGRVACRSLDGIAGAAYEPDGGFADAEKMCLGGFASAARRGVRHHLGRSVDGVRVEGGRAVGLETADGFVPTGQMVLAAGAWTNDLLGRAGHNLVEFRAERNELVFRGRWVRR